MENKPAVEAADQAIAALHDRTDLHTRTIEEARKAARAAIAAYLDELAEARASLERAQKSFAWNEDRRLEAVARAEKAERDVDTLMRRAILAEAARHAR